MAGATVKNVSGIDWDAGALEELARHAAMRDMLEEVATAVRDRARLNASAYYPASRRVQAIIAETGTDSQSAYADVGYDRDQGGFVLWFSEVGTAKMAPRPHLRAALDQTSV